MLLRLGNPVHSSAFRSFRSWLRCAALTPTLFLFSQSLAQASATATETAHISVFAGGSQVETGLLSGSNRSVTVGADLTLRRRLYVNPSLEFRALYPVDPGQVAGERNILGGVKFSGSLRTLHPYGDFLFGRGRLDYSPPLADPQKVFYYIQSTSLVLSPGGGIAVDLGHFFSIFADVQLQHYDSPVTASGRLYAIPTTAGLSYRFNFDRHAMR